MAKAKLFEKPNKTSAKTSRPAKVPMAVVPKKPAPARNKGTPMKAAYDADGDF